MASLLAPWQIVKQRIFIVIVLALTILCEVVDGKIPGRNSGSSFSAGFNLNNKNKNNNAAINNSDDRLNAEQQVARDQLFTALANLATNVISGLLTYLACVSVLDSLSKMGQTFMDGIKEAAVPTWNSSLSPNVTKFIMPNATLNAQEVQIMETVLLPTASDTTFKDLGGLSDVKTNLINCVADLLAQDEEDDGGLGANFGHSAVHGILLYGPPGCGKSKLVEALCKKSKLPMIRIVPSLLLRKYVGETSLMTKAIFSAAKKLQPCLLFVDEMDAMFRERKDGDHHVDRSLVTEFMQLWDTLQAKDQRNKVIIIGATNRPQDLDPAIHRRFERSFLVGPPDMPTRELVFKAILRNVPKEPGFDFAACARLTDGYTPSDITALCKAAISQLIHERRKGGRKSTSRKSTDTSAATRRALCVRDIEQALLSVFPTHWAARSYGSLQSSQRQGSYYPTNSYPPQGQGPGQGPTMPDGAKDMPPGPDGQNWGDNNNDFINEDPTDDDEDD